MWYDSPGTTMNSKGAYLSCIIAGMLQVEGQVRGLLLSQGRLSSSRLEFNAAAAAMPQPLISIQQTSILVMEPMARTMAAVRHAADSGFGTIQERGLFRYSMGATAVPDDSQIYTRGVMEALADLVLKSSFVSEADTAIAPA
jgi:hypothetical protein